jgi:eukaryotic-like serine/threonine-protein kinase
MQVSAQARWIPSVFRPWQIWLALLVLAAVVVLFVHAYFQRTSKHDIPRVQVMWTFEPVERGAIVSSPLVTEDRIFVGVIHDVGFSSVGAVYCLDRLTGKELWKFDDDGRMQHMFSSPCLADGRLYIGDGMHQNFECKLYCLQADSGKKLWDFQVGNHVESSPCVANGKVYFGAGDDGVYCLDAKTGKPCWHFREPLHVDSSPVLVGNHLFAGSGLSRKCKTTEVFCLNASTGDPVWRNPTPWSAWGSPVVDGGHVLFGLGNGRMIEGPESPEKPAGAVWCLQAHSGGMVWQTPLADAVLHRPVVNASRVYVGARNGICYGLDRHHGTVLWQANLGSPVIARPALQGGHLYVVASEGRIDRLHADTGTWEWTFDIAAHTKTRPRMWSSPRVIVDSTSQGEHHWIYVGTELSNGVRSAAVLYALKD